MIDTDKLEQLAKQIHNTLPQGLRDFGEDIEKKIKVILQHQLSKLDVVNRDEFDRQTHVLLRCREKIEKLEQRITALENQQLASVQDSSSHE